MNSSKHRKTIVCLLARAEALMLDVIELEHSVFSAHKNATAEVETSLGKISIAMMTFEHAEYADCPHCQKIVKAYNFVQTKDDEIVCRSCEGKYLKKAKEHTRKFWKKVVSECVHCGEVKPLQPGQICSNCVEEIGQ